VRRRRAADDEAAGHVCSDADADANVVASVIGESSSASSTMSVEGTQTLATSNRCDHSCMKTPIALCDRAADHLVSGGCLGVSW
jgi:hypothetical protein